MSEARWLSGDVFARLADLDDRNLDLARARIGMFLTEGVAT